MNYFEPYTAAERYSKGRPRFHSNTIRHISDFLQLKNKLGSALDIACGTGLSTKPLLEIAANVYGTDTSQSMLNFALDKDKIKYAIAAAAQQPFEDNYFDLVTVGSGVHWFDIDTFLPEARRVLKNKSWLVLYDNFFIAAMENNPGFKDWHQQVYLNKFPAPARNDKYDWSDENLKEQHFDLVKEETFTNPVSFNKNELALYFTSQSNIISVVEKNETTYEEVEDWLDKELTVFFINNKVSQIINFGNWIKYIQKTK
ncbi:MAG: class I SAM-dependent methyltransferase [Ferruginibacter sp.]